MQRLTTLYKIRPTDAVKDAIAVETTNAASSRHPHLLFCGGFHSNMRGNKADFLYHLSLEHGWGYTRFDYRGHGESDGNAEHSTLHDWLDDTLAVLEELPDKTVLIGSSMGAWIAVHAALQQAKKVVALVTIAAAPDFPQTLLWQALSKDQRKALQHGQCVARQTPYDDTQWRLRMALFDSGKALALFDDDAALDIRIPVRMLHGTADKDIPWTYSQRLLEKLAFSPDATLTLIRGADHRLSGALHLNNLQVQLEQLVEKL